MSWCRNRFSYNRRPFQKLWLLTSMSKDEFKNQTTINMIMEGLKGLSTDEKEHVMREIALQIGYDFVDEDMDCETILEEDDLVSAHVVADYFGMTSKTVRSRNDVFRLTGGLNTEGHVNMYSSDVVFSLAIYLEHEKISLKNLHDKLKRNQKYTVFARDFQYVYTCFHLMFTKNSIKQGQDQKGKSNRLTVLSQPDYKFNPDLGTYPYLEGVDDFDKWESMLGERPSVYSNDPGKIYLEEEKSNSERCTMTYNGHEISYQNCPALDKMIHKNFKF